MSAFTNKKLHVLAVSALLVLASCGQPAAASSAPASSNPTSSTPAPEGTSEAPAPSSEAPSSEASTPASSGPIADKNYTYNTYTSISPSNWNELTYQDSNDTQIMSRIGGSFFSYNYQFDAQGKIIPGAFDVQYDALAHAEDVTTDYAGDEKYSVPATADTGFAYEFTLRNDLKWDDGTAITAADFIYTMKEQLNPLFQNYRADTYYNNSVKIHNAYNYVMQGQNKYVEAKGLFGTYSESLDESLVFHCVAPLANDDPYDSSLCYISNYIASNDYLDYLEAYGMEWMFTNLFGLETPAGGFAALEGKTLAEIKADADLKAIWDAILGKWQTEPNEELDFFVTKYQFPATDWNTVGMFADDTDPLKFTLILDVSVPLFKEDGDTLSYHAAYDFGSLPLVKRDLYEANKVAPQMEGGLWTSKYNSSVASTASWGPYKLTSFQAGKEYILERNPNWYGYNMPEYKGQYQTDKIVCETIAQYETAMLAFQSGDVDDIGLDVSVAADYKNSKRAVFSGDEYVASLQLQSDGNALKSHETEGIDKEILTYKDFRQAISVGINRADYTNKCTTASLPGYGLFNAYHYYDVENGKAYRNEDVAKKVLCEVYGVDINAFDSLDEAYASLNGGNNLTLARTLVTSAYNQALADGKITAEDKVELVYGAAVDNVSTRRNFNYMNEAFKEICVGTPLEGRIELKFDASFATSWAKDFRAGAYEICAGGWQGAAWNPGYFLAAYLDKQNMYSQAWDTENQKLTFNPYGDGQEDHTYTMGLMNWWRCLNGQPKASDTYKFDWSDGAVPSSFRLAIIAALEGEVLKMYYTVPLYNWYSASLISYKIEYISRDEHTFMGFGGLRYMTFNYSDDEWEAVKGTFDYKE